MHRLDPDPATAPQASWIFAQRLDGRSVAGIARELNDTGVPCPSQVDPDRNSHRRKTAWMVTTVAAILANPRYTGRQVWNRQPNTHVELDPVDGLDRHREVQRRTTSAQWVMSAGLAHPALVSEADFVAVQQVHTAPSPADGTARRYALTGLVFCRRCGRAMDAHWVHGRPGYRCRHGRSSARATRAGQPALFYYPEDRLLDLLQHDETLSHRYPSIKQAPTHQIGAFLRTHEMILVGDRDLGWVVETPADQLRLTASALPTALQAKIPAPKNGDRKSE